MIKIIVKLFFASSIIYFLIHKNLLEFSVLKKAIHHPSALIISFFLISLGVLISAVRWKILLEIKTQQKLPLSKIAGLTWIGLLFSTILPGALTGDLIKLIYAKRISPKLDKSFLFTSIIFDRVFGLANLLLVSGLFSLLYYNKITTLSPQVKPLVFFNFFLFLGAILFLSSLFFPAKLQDLFLNLAHKIPKIGKNINHLLQQLWLIGKNKKTVFLCFFLGIPIPLITILALWHVTAPFYANPIPLSYAYIFFPIGIISIVIPLAPAGFGLGHATFAFIFGIFGEENGASLFNLFFILTVINNLLGVIPFLFSKIENPPKI